MSRGALIVGLLISVLVHGWLLLGSRSAAPDEADEIEVLEVAYLPPAEAVETPEADDAPAVEPIESREMPADAEAAPPPEPVDEPEPSGRETVPPEPTIEPHPPSPPPVQPVRLDDRPASAPATATDRRGDFAGRADAPPQPSLRIDWGTPGQAQRILSAGGMKLVVLDASGDGAFYRQLESSRDGWRVVPFRSELGASYSRRLRIVDDVAAFDAAHEAATLRAGEHLAVLLPNAVEQMLQTRQLRKAMALGVPLTDVRTFGGRFILDGDRLSFDVTHAQLRR